MSKQSDWVQDVQPRSAIDKEYRPKIKRSARSAAERLRIVDEYDSYPKGSPERGALLRREGIYTSAITKWRKLRQRGALTALASQRPGPKPVSPDPLQAELSRLRAENARLQAPAGTVPARPFDKPRPLWRGVRARLGRISGASARKQGRSLPRSPPRTRLHARCIIC